VIDSVACVEDAVIARQVHGAETKGSIAGFNGSARAVLDGHTWSDTGNDACCVVALSIVADHSAE